MTKRSKSGTPHWSRDPRVEALHEVLYRHFRDASSGARVAATDELRALLTPPASTAEALAVTCFAAEAFIMQLRRRQYELRRTADDTAHFLTAAVDFDDAIDALLGFERGTEPEAVAEFRRRWRQLRDDLREAGDSLHAAVSADAQKDDDE